MADWISMLLDTLLGEQQPDPTLNCGPEIIEGG